MSFGLLTLATPDDYLKAIGLALSARLSNPGIPIAVACSPKIQPLLKPYFDILVDEDPTLRGFVHKVHLDRYSPFDETFFFDSDVLLFRPLTEVLDQWRPHYYAACGSYVDHGFSPFGLDRVRVLQKIGKTPLVTIDGAGHAYFRKPDCSKLFDLAREITANYLDYAGPIRYADEDVVDIAMTILDLPPIPHGQFFSRYLSARKGSMVIDVCKSECRYLEATDGVPHRPWMMHFAANEAPFAYAFQLYKLFKKFGVRPRGPLFTSAVKDFYTTEVKWPVMRTAKRILSPAT